jgi:hypothetical protein
MAEQEENESGIWLIAYGIWIEPYAIGYTL